MRTIRDAVWFLLVCVFAVSAGAVGARAARAASPMAIIGAGNVTASCTITPSVIYLNPDGSFNVVLNTSLNGYPPRQRQNWISADGTQFQLDGQSIASPPAALQALGTHMAAAAPKIAAAYGVAAVQAVVCGP